MDTNELKKWIEMFETEQSDDESYLMEVLQEATRLIADLQARVAALEAKANAG